MVMIYMNIVPKNPHPQRESPEETPQTSSVYLRREARGWD
jgi:hypothetical protein